MTEVIQNRRSIRRFKPGEPLTKAQMNQLLEAAMLAPSACNTRPWEFIAITKREILDEIAETHSHAKMCKTAMAAIIVVALPQEAELPNGFFPQCCGAATQNILLEATAMGFGSCWCGVYPKQEKVEQISKMFNIEAGKIPFCVIAIGHADETPDRRGFFDETKVRYI